MGYSLVIDAGNSRLKMGEFSEGQLTAVHNFPLGSESRLYNFLNHSRCDKVIISSVSIDEDELKEALPKEAEVLILNANTPLPFKVNYETPDTLGKDRIAAVAGSRKIFPEKTVLVIDAGSCVTIDLVTSFGEWIGGNISPGINMRWQAMHHFTKRLPLVNRESISRDMWGHSTATALGNGGAWGLMHELKGYYEDARARYGSVKIVATGGDAPILAEFMKTKIFVEPNLVLTGLHEILEHNN